MIPGSSATENRFDGLVTKLNQGRQGTKHSLLKLKVWNDGHITYSGSIDAKDNEPVIVVGFENNKDGYSNIKKQAKLFNQAFEALQEKYNFNNFKGLGHSNGGLIYTAFIENYLEESKKIKEELTVLAEELSSIRKETALKLEKLIQDELKFLYMEKSTIKVDFKEKEFSTTGKDDVKILISANLGEPLKSLSKVASGGELSRVMLALKIIFSRSIEATSIIFDEIDTGVSGRVSQRMAEKMYQLGVGSQILCISHLPQTTALADTNLLISKEIIDKRTLTVIRELSEEEKIAEVARMVSGDTMTKLSEEHSIEMLRLAEKTKADIKAKLNK